MARDKALQIALGDQRPSVIIHLEVKQHIPKPSATDVAEFHRVNVFGVKTWLQFAATIGVKRFIYFSSIKAVCANPSGLTTELAPGPNRTPYGLSKWLAEKEVQQWVRDDLTRSAVIFRPAVVYGPGNVGNLGAMVAGITNRRFFLVGRNDNIKSLVAVGNVTAAVEFLLPRIRAGCCDVYNIVDRASYSVREIDRIIRMQVGMVGNSPALPLTFARIAAFFGDALHSVGLKFPISSDRLYALLEHTHFSPAKLEAEGFVHRQSTEEGLAAMIDAARQVDC